MEPQVNKMLSWNQFYRLPCCPVLIQFPVKVGKQADPQGNEDLHARWHSPKFCKINKYKFFKNEALTKDILSYSGHSGEFVTTWDDPAVSSYKVP